MVAAQLLGRFGAGAKEAVPALVLALKDKEGLVRAAAADALNLIGGDAQTATVVPVLAGCLKDDDANVRRTAAAALARISPLPPDLAPDLTAALKDSDGLTRLLAAEALSGLPGRTDEAVAVLADALDEPALRLGRRSRR